MNHVAESVRQGKLYSETNQFTHTGQNFVSFQTESQGACALHAIWGHPNTKTHCPTMQCEQTHARKHCSSMLADLDAMNEQFNSKPWFQDVVASLWDELTVPAMLEDNVCAFEERHFLGTLRNLKKMFLSMQKRL